MADEFDLTPRPIRVTGAQKQALQDALDISDYDVVDAVCSIDGLETVTTGALAVRLITGMQKQSEVGWIEVAAFNSGSLDTVGDADAVHAEVKLLKYLRWEVTSIGSASAIVFDISGMLRRHG